MKSQATEHPVPLIWHHPLPRPCTGVHLGNGTLGLLVWGADRLSLTIGRNGFWDRRGGIGFSAQTDFSSLRRLLESGDEDGLKKAFSNNGPALPYRTPTQLPGGRLDLFFQHGAVPELAALDTATGTLRVTLSNGGVVTIRLATDMELAWLEFDAAADPERISLLPAWRWLEQTLSPGGVTAPLEWETAEGGGFMQSLPEDPALAIAWNRRGNSLAIATALGSPAREHATRLASECSLHQAAAAADAWWMDYRRDLPRVELPDAALQRAWDYAVFKQAGMTPPQGVAATLQGPWMAEDELPPWSNDYHFNINLQMIYWPAFPTNRLSHLRPVWNLLRDWLPALQDNAAEFFRTPDALMLPHAVDDRCQVIGNFWQGTIDQACTAWMAQLAWLEYRHTLDEAFLRGTAWPLLAGAFNGFWAMTEEIERNGVRRLSLPVSVSAEFSGWGRDASFQLAAFQMLARILPQAAGVLGEPVDDRWSRVRHELPQYSTMHAAKVWGQSGLRPRIVLWEGMDLPESHRHHSHLAAIYPFCTIDPQSEEHREVVKRSVEHWVTMGSGQWVGWSMPWAAAIWARCDQASAAVSLLRIWEDVFTNAGHGTLHNADSPGYTGWIHGPFLDDRDAARSHDQMQMDAGFGFVQAIAEIFVQQRGGTLHVLPSLPKQWRDFSFDGILCEGAFLVGATVKDQQLREVRITSQRGGLLDLALPSPLTHAGHAADRHTLQTRAGERLVFHHAACSSPLSGSTQSLVP